MEKEHSQMEIYVDNVREHTLTGGKEEKEENTLQPYVNFNVKGDYEEVVKLFSSDNKETFKNKKDGSKITVDDNKITFDETPENIAAAVDIAQDKGWEKIKISGGSRSSKAEIWFQANIRGIETSGYQPTEADKKRLLGAQQRQKEERQKEEGLDIKPKAETQDTKEQKQDDKEKNSKKEEQEKEKTLSQNGRFAVARKEIMAEVQKVMPLNEQEQHDLEMAIDKQLAMAAQGGKTLNVKKVKENIKKGLPYVRKELEHAGKQEQKKQQREGKKRERNPSPERTIFSSKKLVR